MLPRAGAPFASTRTLSIARVERTAPVTQAGPRAAFRVQAHRCFDRPRAERDEHRRTLTRARDQPARVARPQPHRNRRRHQRDAVEQRGDHRAPPVGRAAPDHRAPFELDARVGRGARTERAVRVDDRGPLPRLRRRGREHERDRRGSRPEPHRRSVTVAPRRSPPPGSSAPSGPATASRRSPAARNGRTCPASSESTTAAATPPTVSNICSPRQGAPNAERAVTCSTGSTYGRDGAKRSRPVLTARAKACTPGRGPRTTSPRRRRSTRRGARS